jgi:hypothetical protein
VLAGAIIKLFSAPAAILVDAVSYLSSGILLAIVRPRTPEVAEGTDQPRNLRREIRSWAALGLPQQHARPAGDQLAHLVRVPGHADDRLRAVRAEHPRVERVLAGATYAFTGIGSLIGATASGLVGQRLGVGPAIIACHHRKGCGVALISRSLRRSAFRDARLTASG